MLPATSMAASQGPSLRAEDAELLKT
jgi:hypothetical protein